MKDFCQKGGPELDLTMCSSEPKIRPAGPPEWSRNKGGELVEPPPPVSVPGPETSDSGDEGGVAKQPVVRYLG